MHDDTIGTESRTQAPNAVRQNTNVYMDEVRRQAMGQFVTTAAHRNTAQVSTSLSHIRPLQTRIEGAIYLGTDATPHRQGTFPTVQPTFHPCPAVCFVQNLVKIMDGQRKITCTHVRETRGLQIRWILPLLA